MSRHEAQFGVRTIITSTTTTPVVIWLKDMLRFGPQAFAVARSAQSRCREAWSAVPPSSGLLFIHPGVLAPALAGNDGFKPSRSGELTFLIRCIAVSFLVLRLVLLPRIETLAQIQRSEEAKKERGPVSLSNLFICFIDSSTAALAQGREFSPRR